MGPHGILWTGAAWNSFWTTVKLSAIAAPLTAALGILAAYLLTRQRFVGQSTFEFGTMLSFVIPGTVIGVSYILAFNVPPIEITGTALILVVCNIFATCRLACAPAWRQWRRSTKPRRSVDDARRTRVHRAAHRASAAAQAGRRRRARVQLCPRDDDRFRGHLPCVGRIRMGNDVHHQPRVNGDYGVAIAYSAVLILLMLVAIWIIQKLVGERRSVAAVLRRRSDGGGVGELGGTAA
jgi:iron(III) transport system permease protein